MDKVVGEIPIWYPSLFRSRSVTLWFRWCSRRLPLGPFLRTRPEPWACIGKVVRVARRNLAPRKTHVDRKSLQIGRHHRVRRALHDTISFQDVGRHLLSCFWEEDIALVLSKQHRIWDAVIVIHARILRRGSLLLLLILHRLLLRLPLLLPFLLGLLLRFRIVFPERPYSPNRLHTRPLSFRL
jgi:hypothetical protein